MNHSIFKNSIKKSYLGFTLLISLLILTSCNNSPKHVEFIPKDAQMVAAIDVPSIFKKGNVNNINDLKLFFLFRKQIRVGNKRLAFLLDDIIEEPATTGINYQQDLFYFVINSAKDESFSAFAWGIKDQKKFNAFTENLFDKLGGEYDLEKRKNYRRITVNRTLGLAWDDQKAVLIIPENYRSKENIDFGLQYLMKIKERDQLAKQDKFQRFLNDKQDISLWLSSNLFENMYPYSKWFKESEYDLTNNYWSSHINFEDNDIHITMKVDYNKNMQKQLKKHSFDPPNKSNASLLKYFPKKHYGVASISLKTESVYQALESTKATASFKGFEEATNIPMKKIFDNLQGNMVASLFNIEKKTISYQVYDYEYDDDGNYQQVEKTREKEIVVPSGAIAVDLQDRKLIQKLIKSFAANEIKKRGSYIEIKNGRSYPIYLAYNDNVAYLTNDLKAVKKFKNGGFDEHLGQSERKTAIVDNQLFFWMNLDFSNYPRETRKNIFGNGNDEQQRMLKIWNSFARNIQITYRNQESLKIKFTINEDEGNSLHNLINIIDRQSKFFQAR